MAIKLEIFDIGSRTFAEFKAYKEALASTGIMPNITPVNNGKPEPSKKGSYYPNAIGRPKEIEARKEI